MAPSTTRSTRSRGATAVKGKARALAQEAEEFVEVKGGDFPETWDFDEQGDLIGNFAGTEVKEIKGKDRTIHTFETDETDDDGNPVKVTVWGTAILDSRLGDVAEGSRVKVVKTGKKVATKGGRQAWEWKVFIARGALAR